MRVVGSVLAFYTYKDWPSNHFIREFTLKGLTFNCAEQAIMYCKAMHFRDLITAMKILAEPVPQQQKLLGRAVKQYDDRAWREHRPIYYAIILKAKYRQNPDLLEELLLTDPLILAEASERDTQWGTGLAESDDRISDPTQWRGENLCGQVHMDVRQYFQTNRNLEKS